MKQNIEVEAAQAHLLVWYCIVLVLPRPRSGEICRKVSRFFLFIVSFI